MWHLKAAGFINKLKQPGCCRKKRCLPALPAFMVALLMGAPAYAADIDWTGGNSITVNSGDTVTFKGSWFSVDSITVDEGGTLVIPEETNVQLNNIPEAKLENAGTILVGGTLSLGSYANSNTAQSINFAIKNFTNTGIIDCFIPIRPDPEHDVMNLVIPSPIFNKFMEDGGKIILKGCANVPCRFAISSHDDSAYKFNLPTSEFATSTNESGKIILGEYSTIRFGKNQLEIKGNDLYLGPTKYVEVHNTASEYDVTDSKISRVRGRHLTLTPDNIEKTITLHSGILQPGAGLAPDSDLKAEPSDLTINGTLHLDGGALVLGSGGNQLGVGTVTGNVIIGTNKSVTTPDSALIGRAGNWTMNGDLRLNKSGYFEIGQPYTDNQGNKMRSTLTLNGRFFLNSEFNVNEQDIAILGDMVASSETAIQVTNGGTLNVNNIRMNSGQINFDPPFIADGDTSNASMGGLSFASDNVDGRMNIGRNSMVTLGSTDYEWLRGQIGDYQTKTGQLWGRDITSALAVRSPQTLAANGGINVDGAWVSGGNPAAVNVARFADKSLFVIDGAAIKNRTALDGNGKAALQVESGAKLLITDVATGDEIKVTDNFNSSDVSEAGWTANTYTSTDVQNVISELVDPATGKYVVRVTDGKSPVEAFPALSGELAAVVEKARNQGLNTNAATAGKRFIARAVDNRFIGNSDKLLAAATIESAARIAVAGAAPQMAKTANDAARSAISQITSLAQPSGALLAIDDKGMPIKDKGVHANNFALWIMPLYQSTNGFGMEAGNFDYDFNGALGGVALGADYTFDNMLRLGASFNIGGGYARGTGDLNQTTNSMNFWGIGAYAGWTQNNIGLTADVNYTSTYNKIKQELPDQMAMSDLKSDISAWAISAGLRAEYQFKTEYLEIIPHVGFRFLNLNTDSYDAKSGGSTVLNGDSFTQNIWTFPLGVSFTKNYQLENGWRIKPLLDLNVTPATGDIKAKSNIRFSGIAQEAELDTKMMDYVIYGGTAGIEFDNDTISFGVNYNGQFGAESSAHGIFGTFRYEF